MTSRSTFKRLRLAGPGPGDYAQGESILVFHGRQLIGRVQNVSVSAGGNEVRLEEFMAQDIADLRARGIALLIMAEVIAFVLNHYPAVQIVGLVLSRDIEGFEDRGNTLASASNSAVPSSPSLASNSRKSGVMAPRASPLPRPPRWRATCPSCSGACP